MKQRTIERGFTLVELMIALVIGSIVAAAAYQILVNQSRTYEVQDQSITMQRNARAALDFVCQELRQIGYGLENDEDTLAAVINNNQTTGNNIELDTDSISFIANTIEASIIAADAAGSATSLSVQASPNQAMEFRVGDVVDVLDWNKRLFIHGLTVSGVTAEKGRYTILDFSASLNTAVKAGYIITRTPVVITYRLNGTTLERGQTPLSGGTTSFQPLVDDVEDFQLVYAFDNDGDNQIDVDGENNIIWAVDSNDDGRLDLRVKDDGTTESMTERVEISGNPRDCKIRAVRINILVRTARENPDHRFRNLYTRPSVEDRMEDDTGSDGYRRFLLQRIVKFRNAGIG